MKRKRFDSFEVFMIIMAFLASLCWWNIGVVLSQLQIIFLIFLRRSERALEGADVQN